MSYEGQQATSLSIHGIPHQVDRWDLILKLAEILHEHPFKQPRPDRKMNFDVYLFMDGGTEGKHNGRGRLTLPSKQIAVQFLNHVRSNRVKILGKKLNFGSKFESANEKITATVQKAPYVDPKLEKDREWRVFELDENPLRVVKVQFGVLFRQDPKEPRKYSIEWEREYLNEVGYLTFKFDHKLIKIQLTNPVARHTGTDIVINFASISKIAVGDEYGDSYIIFDTHTPPAFEEFDLHRPMTGRQFDDSHDNPRYKRRIGSVDRIEGHRKVAPFAHTLRVLVRSYDSSDIVQEFRRQCKIAQLQTIIWPPLNRPTAEPIEAAGYCLYSKKNLYRWSTYTAKHDWPVAFQLEGLLHNCLLNVQELLRLTPHFDSLCQQHGSQYVAVLLQRYAEYLSDPGHLSKTPEQSLDHVSATFVYKERTSSQAFSCYHVIMTPTRMILEGPYATDSNRIIRQYAGFEDSFIRVGFCDEDRLRLRWSRELDVLDFLQERVGNVLREGFDLAGRHFELLAYSTSALREHSVWFMTAFQHPSLGEVTSQRIRDSIGDFEVPEDVPLVEGKPPLLWCPSKYAARLAQAFTATESSVELSRHEWDIMPDLGQDPYLHTDGVGTISEELRDEIWEVLCRLRLNRGERKVKPWAFQIRFLGFKGVIVVDRELGKDPSNPIRMRLRPSMHKFENSTDAPAHIEIAEVFEKPLPCYFNKALVMILEDRGVPRSAFLDLLGRAVADAKLVDGSLFDCQAFFGAHGFGRVYDLPKIFDQLKARNAEIDTKDTKSRTPKTNIDSEFLKELRQVARMQVLKEIKHDAHIPIPDSYLLAGVADEGPSYLDNPGYHNIYCLPENHIYACVQGPDDEEPKWIDGACLIWRSPLTHPGDLQKVNAIGKPPPNSLFGHLINVVVLPSRGHRSLASCLGGGDLDGDTFTVCTCTDILPTINVRPAQYPPGEDFSIGRNSTIADVSNFIVEYFHSDVLGILSDRLLVIADQSERGIFDRQCEDLATLCSQAVDYPKKGHRVDISGDRLPRSLIRANPDWHGAEVVNPRKSDYYESTRALGFMYREITLPESPKEPVTGQPKPLTFETEKITGLLRDDVLRYLPSSSFDGLRRDEDIEYLFNNYNANLRYISAIHTLSNDSTVRLKEEEIILGVILANCQQRGWRRNRMYRMKTHTSNLVKDTKRGFQPLDRAEDIIEDRGGLLHILDKAWYAWISPRESEFGTNSFRLIALGSILECLEKLNDLPVVETVETE